MTYPYRSPSDPEPERKKEVPAWKLLAAFVALNFPAFMGGLVFGRGCAEKAPEIRTVIAHDEAACVRMCKGKVASYDGPNNAYGNYRCSCR